MEDNGDMNMAGIIKTKGFLQSVLNSEYLGDNNVPTKANVGTDSTAPTENDTTLGTKVLIDGGYDRAFQSGFPSVDETALKAETRIRLGTTDANGNLLVEIGTLDASDNLKDRGIFSSISKASADIAIFSIKTKVRNVQ